MNTRSITAVSRCVGLGFVAALAACGSQPELNAPNGQLQCTQITGVGETVGDRNLLKGDGVFKFGDVERVGQVGLYLFEMFPAANNGLDVQTQYQFHWGDGDSFLSKDKIYFEPTLEPDKYRFTIPMTVVSGSGIFANVVGQTPLTLTAEMQFGPPPNPGDARTAFETFEVGGTVCQ